jgi:DNA helicase-2/ATP-dependent DNA helicase PcrA
MYAGVDKGLDGIIYHRLVKNRQEMLVEAAEDIRRLKDGGMKSIADILRTERLCREFHKGLSDELEIGLVTAEREEFFTGTAIIPCYLSKGLEFDAVLVLCPDNGSYVPGSESKLAYTVCSRALHKLHIISSVGLPGFLGRVGKTCYEIVGTAASSM